VAGHTHQINPRRLLDDNSEKFKPVILTQKVADLLREPAFQMTIQECLEVIGENSDCSRGRTAWRFDGMCTLPYDENQLLVFGRTSLANDRGRTTNTNSLCALPISIVFQALAATCSRRVGRCRCPRATAGANRCCFRYWGELEISRVTRNGISAAKVDVFSHGEKDLPREIYWEQKERQAEHSAHNHGDGEHAHDHAHAHAKIAEPVALLEHNYALQNSTPGRDEAASPPKSASAFPFARTGHDHKHGRQIKMKSER